MKASYWRSRITPSPFSWPEVKQQINQTIQRLFPEFPQSGNSAIKVVVFAYFFSNRTFTQRNEAKIWFRELNGKNLPPSECLREFSFVKLALLTALAKPSMGRRKFVSSLYMWTWRFFIYMLEFSYCSCLHDTWSLMHGRTFQIWDIFNAVMLGWVNVMSARRKTCLVTDWQHQLCCVF